MTGGTSSRDQSGSYFYRTGPYPVRGGPVPVGGGSRGRREAVGDPNPVQQDYRSGKGLTPVSLRWHVRLSSRLGLRFTAHRTRRALHSKDNTDSFVGYYSKYAKGSLYEHMGHGLFSPCSPFENGLELRLQMQ